MLFMIFILNMYILPYRFTLLYCWPHYGSFHTFHPSSLEIFQLAWTTLSLDRRANNSFELQVSRSWVTGWNHSYKLASMLKLVFLAFSISLPCWPGCFHICLMRWEITWPSTDFCGMIRRVRGIFFLFLTHSL
jgi:hypothetical protein